MRFFGTMKEVFVQLWHSVVAAFNNTIYYIGGILNMATPYVMLYFGLKAHTANLIDVWWIVFVLTLPIGLRLLTWIMQAYASRIGKGAHIPIPTERFTTCSDDGEVSMPYERQQELLLWAADVEDWLERRGLL